VDAQVRRVASRRLDGGKQSFDIEAAIVRRHATNDLQELGLSLVPSRVNQPSRGGQLALNRWSICSRRHGGASGAGGQRRSACATPSSRAESAAARQNQTAARRLRLR